MKMTGNEAADIIERFVNHTDGNWDWDDFISISVDDPEIESIRKECNRTHENFPPDSAKGWCNPQGVERLLELARKLRGL
jgi:hypothetical protein